MHGDGRTAPRTPETARSTPAPARPWQLDNRAWLTRRYLMAGDRTIAKELGVARETVARARKRAGIASGSPGARRGTTSQASRRAGAQPSNPAAVRIAHEIQHAQPGSPQATLELISDHIKALHDISQAGTTTELIDALINLAVACGRLADHLERRS
jgi:hypothetical protein